MSNKIGIYITGLGQSIDNETVEKYAERFRNELSFKTTGSIFHLQIEKIFYQPEKESTIVSIFQRDKDTKANEKLIYKIYDFQYHKILTEKFERQNIIIKNLILFGLVLKKTPQIIMRLFKRNGFSRPLQTFYAFLILFVITMCVLFLIPSSIDLMFENEDFIKKWNEFIKQYSPWILDEDLIKYFGKKVLAFTTLILILAPNSKTILTSLATEFACVDSYIANGEQSQLLLGNLDQLIEYIAECEVDPEIHFHCYSFGSALAIDALFPVAEIPPSDNIQKYVKLMITTGNPFEFLNAYYPVFYTKRSNVMENKITWINIYSLSDVLATNYRKDGLRGEAEFGIGELTLKPKNINYEITTDKNGLIDFFSLTSIKMHKCYWDPNTIGQSCFKVLTPELLQRKFIEL